VANLAVVVNALAALFADDAWGFVAGHLAGVDGDLDPLFLEEVGVDHLAVGEHLLLVFVFDLRVEIAGALLGGFEGGDADAFVRGGAIVEWIQGEVQIDEGGGHLPPVAEFESTLAEAAAGDDGDGVGGAAIDFDEGDETLAVGGAGLGDAEALAAEHGEADAEDLAGAEVAVGELGLAEEVVEGLHGVMIRRC